MASERREFLRLTVGGVAGLALGTKALEVPRAAPADEWLEAIAGKKYRAFIDVGRFAIDGVAFRRATALFTALRANYGAADSDIGVALGAHSTALAHLLSPALWDELRIAELVAPALATNDAAVLRSGKLNWAIVGREGVQELRARGVRILACRNTIARWARELAVARGGNANDLARTLTSGLDDGVEPVPAMIAADVLAQQKGVPYVAIE